MFKTFTPSLALSLSLLVAASLAGCDKPAPKAPKAAPAASAVTLPPMPGAEPIPAPKLEVPSAKDMERLSKQETDAPPAAASAASAASSR